MFDRLFSCMFQAKVMRNSMSSLSDSPGASPKQLEKVHLDIFSEIHNILSCSPPVSPSNSPSPPPSGLRERPPSLTLSSTSSLGSPPSSIWLVKLIVSRVTLFGVRNWILIDWIDGLKAGSSRNEFDIFHQVITFPLRWSHSALFYYYYYYYYYY